MKGVSQAAGWPPGAAQRTEPGGAPDPSAQDAQDDGSQPEGHFIGECGHRVPGGPVFHVGPCRECDASAT